ncbi:MAG TPA: NusA N-terminal domain-containing protein, partial [Terriglobales bacterium]|nr:NusA N-terminal domain-containing protein [Terriglobales bacterium]
MASLLYQQIEGLSKEKGIDPAIVVGAVEDAVAVATRKNLKTQENLRGVLDKESGAIEIFAVKTIVETPELVEDPNLQISLDEARKQDAAAEVGGELKTHRASHSLSQPTGLGRISAQIAKQVIFQKVREAERDTVFAEYSGRIGEVVTAAVKRVEGPDVIFEVGKT